MLMEEYIIECPNCKSTFDVENEMDKWKLKILHASKFMKEIRELLEPSS